MTIKELELTDLKDCTKKRIIEVANATHERNGTPLDRAIQLVYNAYTTKSLKD